MIISGNLPVGNEMLNICMNFVGSFWSLRFPTKQYLYLYWYSSRIFLINFPNLLYNTHVEKLGIVTFKIQICRSYLYQMKYFISLIYFMTSPLKIVKVMCIKLKYIINLFYHKSTRNCRDFFYPNLKFPLFCRRGV